MLILALDFGGTKLTAATWRPEMREWLAHQRRHSPEGGTVRDDLRLMGELAREVLDGAQPGRVGISFGGPVDYKQGVVRLSHHVPGWEAMPLAAHYAAEFGCLVRVDNDANVAALGEQRFGAGRGVDHLCYLTISTGVGGGWILNGQPWRGAEGMAGEIGHLAIDPQGPLCLCGQRGCVERYASGPYMATDVRAQLAADPAAGPIVRQLVGDDLEQITGAVVAAAAARGDPVAQARLDLGAWGLGQGIGGVANVVNPQRFVLGGGVTKAGERWWERVRASARAAALREVAVEIVPAFLGDDAPLWGAVGLVL